MKNNLRYKALRQTISLSVMIMFILFLVPFSSAFEFDNVKSYDEETKTATITNALGLGDKIADIPLKSNQHEQLGLGYQKVFEYEINSYSDYPNFIQELEIYNLKNDLKENKQIDLKYLTYEDVEADDYQETCSLSGNGTNICYNEVIGKKIITQEVWKDLTSMDVKAEKITISGWTDVQQGDYYEWIPQFAGVKIQEWATWSGNLSTGLTDYWTNNQANSTGNGTYNNITTTWDKTVYGSTFAFPAGKLSNALNFTDTATRTGFATNNRTFNYNISFTENFWINGVFDNNAQNFVWGSYACKNCHDDAGIQFIVRGNGTIIFNKNSAGAVYEGGNITLSNSTWYMITIQNDGTGIGTYRVYVNGVLGYAKLRTGAEDKTTLYSIEKSALTTVVPKYITFDEHGRWNRTLTEAEISILYNSGNGCTYGNETCYSFPPTITLNEPVDTYNSTDKDITFNCTGTDDILLSSITFMLNGATNGTNTSVYNNTKTSFVRALADNNYNWSCKAVNNASLSTTATNRSLTVNTIPTINIFSPPTNTSNYSTQTIYLNATSTLPVGTWIYNFNGTNYTLSTINTSVTIPDGNYRLLLYGNNSDSGMWGLNDTIYFNVDATLPTILVTGGNGTATYQNFSTNHTLNYTITDTNLDDCWINYNETNRTIPCTSGSTNTTNFTLQFGLYNATIWVNDTFGNNESRFVEWAYRFLYMNESYTSTILEGITSTFTLNLYTNGSDITIAQLSYDGTDSYGSIADNGGNFFTVTKTQAAPIVTTDTNKTFYWNLTQNSIGYYNFTPHNQTVLNLGTDNCSNNTNVLYNFTMVDEEYQTEINETGSNSFAELNLQLYTYGTTTLVQEFNSQYNQTNPFAVCFNNTLTTEQFNGDLQVRFWANAYETEYYHIQNATINATNMIQNITLYDLNTSDSQVFKIIFRDNSYTAITSALITIYRKYIDEGVFKIVEIPRTDAKGETLAHLVLNDIIYNFVISKDGVNITSFNNVLAVCQTPLVSPCIIDFTEPSGSIDVSDFETNEDFNFTLTYNETSRVISTTYSIPSGTPSWVTLNVTSEDAVMTAVCSDYVTSASGTLTCIVPASIGNSTIRATLYKDGTYQAFGTVKLDQDASGIYGSVLILLSVIVLISIIGIGVSNNPIITVIFLMVGAILIYSLNLVTNSGFLGATATILFLLIGCVLILIKGARRN